MRFLNVTSGCLLHFLINWWFCLQIFPAFCWLIMAAGPAANHSTNWWTWNIISIPQIKFSLQGLNFNLNFKSFFIQHFGAWVTENELSLSQKAASAAPETWSWSKVTKARFSRSLSLQPVFLPSSSFYHLWTAYPHIFGTLIRLIGW